MGVSDFTPKVISVKCCMVCFSLNQEKSTENELKIKRTENVQM